MSSEFGESSLSVIPAPVFAGINSGGNPDVVPAKAGNQKHIKLDSCFCRNDKPAKWSINYSFSKR